MDNKHILLVEDNDELRWLVRETLSGSSLPLQLHEAADGHAALRLLAQQVPQVLILDVMLPDGIDGYHLCQHVKSQPARFPGTLVIMLTARGQRSDLEKGRAAGADLYLVKPFSPAELLLTIEAHFGDADSAQA